VEEREQQSETRHRFCLSAGPLEIEARHPWRKDTSEKRYLVIGTINHEHWSAIITYRGGAIRIISVRKSTPSEIATYEKIAG